MDSIDANSISTFGGNPLAMAGALANLEYLIAEDLQTNTQKVGQHLKSALEDLGERIDIIGEVRGKGLMLGVEMVKPGTREPNPQAASAVMEKARAYGLLVGKGGIYGNVFRLAPPLSLTQAEADEGYAIMERAFEEVAGG
jgi:4-aminobutyrate aminotransferase